MQPTDKAKVFDELKLLAAILGADVAQKVLQAYVEILAAYPKREVLAAIKWAATNCKFFPKPVELLERTNPAPTREDADAVAGRAIEAIYRFGLYRSKEAQIYIGHEGWKAVSRVGGWRTLCDSREDQLGTLRAQLRDQCLSVMNDKEVRRREDLRIEKNQGGYALGDYAQKVHEFEKEKQRQLGEIKKLNFDDFKPGDKE